MCVCVCVCMITMNNYNILYYYNDNNNNNNNQPINKSHLASAYCVKSYDKCIGLYHSSQTFEQHVIITFTFAAAAPLLQVQKIGFQEIK